MCECTDALNISWSSGHEVHEQLEGYYRYTAGDNINGHTLVTRIFEAGSSIPIPKRGLVGLLLPVMCVYKTPIHTHFEGEMWAYFCSFGSFGLPSG